MDSGYQDDDLLLLSGIQHMAFCERQWALIHIEQVWAENVRTVEGKHLHERADDPFLDEARGDKLIIRAMPIISRKLGLQGVADVVEFNRSEHIEGFSCVLDRRKGEWIPHPIEYKRGKPKPDDRDAVQLCAQAIALEEMMNISVKSGSLFYGMTKHREAVLFNEKLREHTENLANKMHAMFSQGITPSAVKQKQCNQCSLQEKCQPDLLMRTKTVKDYIQRMIKMGDGDF